MDISGPVNILRAFKELGKTRLASEIRKKIIREMSLRKTVQW